MQAVAQIKTRELNPVIDYSRTPREYVIGGIVVEGVTNYDDDLLIGLSGRHAPRRRNNTSHQTVLA